MNKPLSKLPNILTISRIALIPILTIAFFMDSQMGRWLAAIAFSLACFTDFLDGYVARLWSQTSVLGQFLDPVADKLLVSSTLLLLAGFGRISSYTLIPALIILCREILVSGLREMLSELKVGMPVTFLAKWKTAIQMVAIGLLLLGDTVPGDRTLQAMGEGLLWTSAILTLITGYDYMRAGLRHF